MIKTDDMMYLTQGERLFIFRRRQKMSQSKFADRYGIKQLDISLMERGKRKLPPELLLKNVALTKGEQATILRRRAKESIDMAAARLGKSRVYVMDAEKDIYDASKLLVLYAKYRKLSPSG